MKIQILPTQLANQIAAGEVVERPASVVKELVENSLDSAADRIEIDIERGGHKRICITDNGSGIAKNELVLALSRHATSKIFELNDLEKIVSLGFRGEALASVSSVSRLTITSKPANQDNAWQAVAQGRDMKVDVRPAAHPRGTSVDVLDLFFNTPARRKFLRAEKTEFNHIDEVVRRIALSRFEIGFTLKHNGKVVRKYPAIKANNNDISQQQKRVASVCGKTFTDSSIYINSQFQSNTLTGWIAGPGQERTQSDLQYFYVNGRMMRDKLINHAVRQAFEGLIAPDSFPAFVLYLTLPSQQVDVNVHPAKHEVRFHQSRLIHDFIFRSVTDALGQSLQTDTDHRETAQDETTHLPNVQPNHDYIRPLQAQGIAEGPKGNKSGYSNLGLRGPVNSAAASNYQTLMRSDYEPSSPDNSEAGADACLHVLPVEELWLLVAFEEKFLRVSAKSLYLFKLKSQMQHHKVVSQPLLMPVTIQCQKKIGVLCEQLSPSLSQAGCELTYAHSKVILKQVPAGLRNLNWSNILAEYLKLIVVEDFDEQNSEALILLCIAQEQSSLGQRTSGSLMQLWFWFVGIDNWQKKLMTISNTIPLPEWLENSDDS